MHTTLYLLVAPLGQVQRFSRASVSRAIDHQPRSEFYAGMCARLHQVQAKLAIQSRYSHRVTAAADRHPRWCWSMVYRPLTLTFDHALHWAFHGWLFTGSNVIHTLTSPIWCTIAEYLSRLQPLLQLSWITLVHTLLSKITPAKLPPIRLIRIKPWNFTHRRSYSRNQVTHEKLNREHRKLPKFTTGKPSSASTCSTTATAVDRSISDELNAAARRGRGFILRRAHSGSLPADRRRELREDALTIRRLLVQRYSFGRVNVWAW